MSKPWITEQEFVDAVELFRHDLVEAARRSCISIADVEDAVQNGVMWCVGHLEQYEPEKASLKTWVTKKVIWAARDINYQHERDIPPVVEDDGAYIQARPKEDRAYDTRYETDEPSYDTKIELRLAVHEALAKLPESDRNIAVALFLEEYTVDEAAAKLNIARTTLVRRVPVIKNTLRGLLVDAWA